ncbi:hypothetical protein, partial [Nocardioides jensenii]|uniref:hypothetical protein n=1 Tax=Nocardioides jensenii TaxID=1843 RepID=UPI000A67EEF5
AVGPEADRGVAGVESRGGELITCIVVIPVQVCQSTAQIPGRNNFLLLLYLENQTPLLSVGTPEDTGRAIERRGGSLGRTAR